MKIYQRYIAREVSAAILLVLLAFLALFAFFDMLGEVKNFGQGGYQIQHAFGYVMLRLPGRTYELMPLAILIGTLYALSALSRHSEITVLRVSGLSNAALLRGLFQIAGMFALLTFLIGEYVAPPAEQAASQLRLKERGRTVRDLKSGLWVRDESSFINVRFVLPDMRLQGIRIFDFDEHARLRSVTEAAAGEYVVPDGWRLTEVAKTVLHEDSAEVEKLAEMRWQSALNPDILAVLMLSPDRMSLRHLSAYTKHLSENHQKTNRYDIAFWKKVIYPLAGLVMVALALPFAGGHYRATGISLKIFSGVMVGILFHMLNGLFSNLGAINSWSPLLSAATPSALFLLAAATMIWWVERR
ncbi:LPS export ABC transporter permease LptG [Accumulibacter sp.]|uniref:LPS export ABC transporter permease LptG n=1 Tax=Candidatus Accumulibacter proximus TaxID=2954385 RepID=A0A935UH90_9PROT|nr:LPS export ABC transporter permease LptG [Accumulibacter sp.]MBK7675233.1 LPS export ABC transporter permease LptG [Candidatus Accumulibacter proximus]MBL8375992.1 LPS export ABC transporter permease LptG [Accumulibacter sp.]